VRWTKKRLKRGNVRIIRKFLWLPRTIKDETRWLEYAKIKQSWARPPYPKLAWFGFSWIDDCFVREER